MKKESIQDSAVRLAVELAALAASLLDREDLAGESTPSEGIKTPFSTMTQSDWAEAVSLWNQNGRPLIAGLAKRRCPACGSSEKHRHLFDSYDGYPYVECSDCGCWHVPLSVDAPLFERFFAQCPQAKEVSRRSFEKRLTEDNLQADLIRFDAYFDALMPLLDGIENRHYLDIGCGLGNSLQAARKRGLNAYGIESSVDCIRLGQQAGTEIHHVSEPLSVDKFGLISFWESLEHIDEPDAALSLCNSLLAEDGLIAFSVPNLDSPLIRTQRADCSVVHGGYDTPGHINLFGPAHLRQLFSRNGFELLQLDGQYGLNLPELVSYLVGHHKGAHDLLCGTPVDHGLSNSTISVLETIGPAATLLERVTRTTPILFGIACRKSSVGRHAAGRAALNARHKATLLEQATAASPYVVNWESEIERLRQDLRDRGAAVEQAMQEIAKRDELLQKTQNEVNRRDSMLAKLSGQATTASSDALEAEIERLKQDLRDRGAAVEQAMQEITKRDELLQKTQNEVNRRDSMLANQATELAKLSGEVLTNDEQLAVILDEDAHLNAHIKGLQSRVDYFERRRLSVLIRGLCAVEDWLFGHRRRL